VKVGETVNITDYLLNIEDINKLAAQLSEKACITDHWHHNYCCLMALRMRKELEERRQIPTDIGC
jgi:hypothetical protein